MSCVIWFELRGISVLDGAICSLSVSSKEVQIGVDICWVLLLSSVVI